MIADIGKIVRRVAARIPGTEENDRARVATEKRMLEKKLRASGMGRGTAKAEVARRFRDGTL